MYKQGQCTFGMWTGSVRGESGGEGEGMDGEMHLVSSEQHTARGGSQLCDSAEIELEYLQYMMRWCQCEASLKHVRITTAASAFAREEGRGKLTCPTCW